MTAEDGAAQVFVEATRVTAVDANGFPTAGNLTYSTSTLIKATIAPVVETGDDIAVKNASGDLAVIAKHGDMVKRYTVTLDLATPDPALEAILCGGNLLTDDSSALTTPVGLDGEGSAGGSLTLLGTYGYKVTAANQYGETSASSEATVTLSGSDASASLSCTADSGAVWYRWYGRISGGPWQLIGQTTDPAFVDDGSVTPNGALPLSNTTAGPGLVGVSAPELGIVGNPDGVGVELWGKAIIDGQQATYLPYWHWLIPLARNFHVDSRDATNANLQNTYVGDAFGNVNWGTGPFADWPLASDRVWQRVRASAETLPVPSLSAVPATA